MLDEFGGLWKHGNNQHALVPLKTECGCPRGRGIKNGHIRYPSDGRMQKKENTNKQTNKNSRPLTGLDATGRGAVVAELAERAEGVAAVGAVAHVAGAVLDDRVLAQAARAVDHVHHGGQRGLQQQLVVALVLLSADQLLDL